MTNEELLQDLKQFITATVSQQTAHLATKDDVADLKGDINRLELRMDQTETKLDQVIERLDGVAGMVEDIHKKQEGLIDKVNEHDVRLGRLEHKLA